jgi:hypothetical protein
MSLRPFVVAACAGCLAMFTAGCSIQTDSAPRDIDPERERELQAPEPGAGGAPATGSARIYLLNDTSERLSTVARQPAGSDAQALLEVLFEGANDAEVAEGLTSAIPPGTTLHSATVRGNVVTVDIGDEMSDLPSAELVVAIAQIVYTANEVTDDAEVVIRVDGERRAWPDLSRRQLSRALTIYDFVDLPESAQPAYPSNFTNILPTTTTTTTVPPTTTAPPTTAAATPPPTTAAPTPPATTAAATPANGPAA